MKDLATSYPEPDLPLRLLGGLTPTEFLRNYWQRKPLLVRGAWDEATLGIRRAELFALAARDDVEARLVKRTRSFSLEHGPFSRRALPRLRERRWTLLVQGVDLHVNRGRALLDAFRFLPDARLDDLMISFATDGGGVGPHVDSYDVFLLQGSGRRRWRFGRQRELALDERAPLKILRRFEPTAEHVLAPGDLLYLPPQWAHEGVALGGDCMTYSIGMRAPQRASLGAELVQRMAETYVDDTLYRDPRAAAQRPPAELPSALARFAAESVHALADRRAALERALGEVLSEPKPRVWFEGRSGPLPAAALELDRRTKMLYDASHAFINGEAVPLAGHDARLLRALANDRGLSRTATRRAGRATRALLEDWYRAGWLRVAL